MTQAHHFAAPDPAGGPTHQAPHAGLFASSQTFAGAYGGPGYSSGASGGVMRAPNQQHVQQPSFAAGPAPGSGGLPTPFMATTQIGSGLASHGVSSLMQTGFQKPSGLPQNVGAPMVSKFKILDENSNSNMCLRSLSSKFQCTHPLFSLFYRLILEASSPWE